jgi:hypothetical protein
MGILECRLVLLAFTDNYHRQQRQKFCAAAEKRKKCAVTTQIAVLLVQVLYVQQAVGLRNMFTE